MGKRMQQTQGGWGWGWVGRRCRGCSRPHKKKAPTLFVVICWQATSVLHRRFPRPFGVHVEPPPLGRPSCLDGFGVGLSQSAGKTGYSPSPYRSALLLNSDLSLEGAVSPHSDTSKTTQCLCVYVLRACTCLEQTQDSVLDKFFKIIVYVRLHVCA